MTDESQHNMACATETQLCQQIDDICLDFGLIYKTKRPTERTTHPPDESHCE